MKMLLIYTLSDPRNGEIRYVGKSSNGLKRARSHEYPSALKRDNSYCGNWIKSLHKAGLKPVIEILEEHSDHDLLIEAECFWIAQFRSLGFKLTNLTDGGEGQLGFKKSDATRKKLSLALLGNTNSRGKERIITPDVRKKFEDMARNRSSDPSIRGKISRTLTGHKQSVETVARRSKSLKGKGTRAIVDGNGTVYESGKAAAVALGISPSHICSILKGYGKGKYSFRYLEE